MHGALLPAGCRTVRSCSARRETSEMSTCQRSGSGTDTGQRERKGKERSSPPGWAARLPPPQVNFGLLNCAAPVGWAANGPSLAHGLATDLERGHGHLGPLKKTALPTATNYRNGRRIGSYTLSTTLRCVRTQSAGFSGERRRK